MAKTASIPSTTAQSLGALIKSARDIMRKDKGLSGDLDRLPALTWVMFLKFLDDMEQLRETDAQLKGEKFKPAIEPPYRWRDWAANPMGITGDELIAFINQDEAMRPDGKRGAGLFKYLRSLDKAGGGKNGSGGRRDVIATVFKGTVNRMINGYLLRDVVNKIGGIHFNSSEEIHTLGHLYESMLKEMRDAAGDSGEFYTPRAVVRFMVAVTDPKLGEVVLDPACGTGGFLVESLAHLSKQANTVQKRQALQESSILGGEAKPLPYLLAQMNLLLHGLESPRISPGNSLNVKITEIGDRDRVDVILTNPPFGGEEEPGILSNFPSDLQTRETAILFLQLILRKLKRPIGARPGGRAAVIVPNTTLFYPGITAKVRKLLLERFNLRAVVRLPKGVFEPYTDIETNILFIDTQEPAESILYYRLDPPNDRKQYTKTQPLKFEELEECLECVRHLRAESPHAWFVRRLDVLRDPLCVLDFHNPKAVRTAAEDPATIVAKFSASLEEIGCRYKRLTRAIDELKSLLQDRETWKTVQLNDVLVRRKDACDVEEGTVYKRVRIQVKGRGVVLRDEVDGAKIGTKRQFRIATGQFALSKIDARNGAFGVVPEECDGAIITGNFWAYDVDAGELRPRLLHHLSQSDAFTQFCRESSPGATNRRYLQEDQFLARTVRVPSALADQDRLCDVLDQIRLLSRIQELDFATMSKSAPLLAAAALHEVFGGDVASGEEADEAPADADEAVDELQVVGPSDS
jgi:type I restriction enzyme M protein